LWYVKLPVGFKRLNETPPYRPVKNKQQARSNLEELSVEDTVTIILILKEI
jgi:hypothetical protein